MSRHRVFDTSFLQLGYVLKGADETVNSSTTLQDDDDLVLALSASQTYAFEAFIVYNAAAAPDYKCAFTVPSGATLYWEVVALNSSAVLTKFTTTSSGGAVSLVGTGADIALTIHGVVIVSTTAGNLQYQFAQNTSDGGNTTTKAGSWLRSQQVS